MNPASGRSPTQSLGSQTVVADSLSVAVQSPAPSASGTWVAGGDAAISLPPALAARAFAPAWVLAVAVHFALVALLAVGPGAPPVEEAPIRLVFVEPPPPPAAPLGAANGTCTVAALPEVAPKVEEPVAEPARPVVQETQQLRRADAKAKPKPRPKPVAKPAEEPPREISAAEIAPGSAAGAVGGEAGGVVGGVVGGIAGGVVGGAGTGPVPVGQVANPPSLVRRVAPVYPEEARRRDVEGLVLLEAVLDREGRIEPGVKVLTSIPLLDDEAIAAVRQWRFRPARDKNGEPLRVILEVPIRFVLR